MREFFSMEGTFNKYAGFVADMIILSFLWVFFSAVTLTIGVGASTTAMYYVATRRIANREGYISSDFWQSFKANFFRSTLVWIVLSASVVLILISMWTGIQLGDEMGALSGFVLPVQIVTLVEILFISTYIFPVLARFDMGLKEALKTCFFMANRHLLTSLLCVGTLWGLILMVLFFPELFPLIFAVPGIYAMLSSHLIMRIFKRYRPEMDKDPILELQEIERERAEEKRLAELGKTTIIKENHEEETNENI